MSQLFPEDIDELNAELRRLLDAELSAGNVVVETWRGSLCANMSETTLKFFKVEGTESLHDRNRQQKS